MAGYWGVVGPMAGVRREDILQAERIVCEAGRCPEEDEINSAHIGSRFNEWRRPVADYGSNRSDWEVKLKASPYVGDIEFGRKDWARARAAVDEVLKLMRKEILVGVSNYEHLKMERYVHQGSARDGLKVIAPDEFDTLIQFHIEGLKYTVVHRRQRGKIIPEFCDLEVQHTMEDLQRRYPALWRAGAFATTGERIYLSSRALHERVFESIIDVARQKVMEEIAKLRRPIGFKIDRSSPIGFKIDRSMNPPSVNIKIYLDDAANQYLMGQGLIANPSTDIRQIDVDLVPGLLVRTDQVPDPSFPGRTMDCPVYAVFKWMEEASVDVSVFKDNHSTIWRISAAGYEKHTLDLARCQRKQRYIITALRLMKTYFRKTKDIARQAGHAPPQIVTALRSYDLKHITFYMILYLCHLNDVRIDGVHDALLYFITFLQVALEQRRLPHFFHSNKLMRHMYPSYPFTSEPEVRFDLFAKRSRESLAQAQLSLENHLNPNFGFGWGCKDEQRLKIRADFKAEVSHGEFLDFLQQ